MEAPMRPQLVADAHELASEAIRRTVAAAVADHEMVGIHRRAREIAAASGVAEGDQLREELVRACIAAHVNVQFGSDS
jgi:hypothetical protein